MPSTGNGEDEEVADEEKPPLREEGKESQQQQDDDAAADGSTMPTPLPTRMRRTDSDRHSFSESVHSVLTSIHHFKLPKWQYRLLVGAVILLAAFLVLLLVVSLIYGFGLQVPQVIKGLTDYSKKAS